jgi:hypothetical protein
MLNQNHTVLVKGFMGQTTAFDPATIKPTVLVLAENKLNGEARYIHGIKGQGFFTFYGGHDPEDYQHRVGDPKTELELHPNSPATDLFSTTSSFLQQRKRNRKLDEGPGNKKQEIRNKNREKRKEIKEWTGGNSRHQIPNSKFQTKTLNSELFSE